MLPRSAKALALYALTVLGLACNHKSQESPPKSNAQGTIDELLKCPDNEKQHQLEQELVAGGTGTLVQLVEIWPSLMTAEPKGFESFESIPKDLPPAVGVRSGLLSVMARIAANLSLDDPLRNQVGALLLHIAKNDPVSMVRARAISCLQLVVVRSISYLEVLVELLRDYQVATRHEPVALLAEAALTTRTGQR